MEASPSGYQPTVGVDRMPESDRVVAILINAGTWLMQPGQRVLTGTLSAP